MGACSFHQQKAALSQVLELLKSYKKVVLGDREFCSVDLAGWMKKQPLTDFCVRLKRSHYIQVQNSIWMQLKDVGLAPGVSLYFQGVKVTKSQGFLGGNIACKWKRKYQGKTALEGWFILTSLKDFSAALKAYQKRFGIEEMFRDFKSGGYDIEGSYVDNNRLISLMILVTLAYTSSIMCGQKIKQKGASKYAVRPREPHRTHHRHSSFYIGLHGLSWVESLEIFAQLTEQLMALSPHKRPYYQRGHQAQKLIRSSL